MKNFLFEFLCLLLISISSVSADSTDVRQVADGVKLHSIHLSEGPLEVDIMEIDLNNPNIEVSVGIANKYIAHGGERVTDFVKRKSAEGEIIYGAVNGDFFGGNPWQAENSMIINGEFAKGVRLNRTQFGILETNTPITGNFKFLGLIYDNDDTVNVVGLNIFPKPSELTFFNKYIGEYLTIPDSLDAIKLFTAGKILVNRSAEFTVEQYIEEESIFHIDENEFFIVGGAESIAGLKSKFPPGEKVEIYLSNEPDPGNFITLIGGLPGLVNDGKRPESFVGVEGMRSEKFIGPNPRTAVGFDSRQNKLFIMVVDGREEGVSIGMSLYDLSDFLISLGCDYAVNLDGGGSTAMVVDGSLVITPSDETGERPVHNFLYVKKKIQP